MTDVSLPPIDLRQIAASLSGLQLLRVSVESLYGVNPILIIWSSICKVRDREIILLQQDSDESSSYTTVSGMMFMVRQYGNLLGLSL